MYVWIKYMDCLKLTFFWKLNTDLTYTSCLHPLTWCLYFTMFKWGDLYLNISKFVNSTYKPSKTTSSAMSLLNLLFFPIHMIKNIITEGGSILEHLFYISNYLSLGIKINKNCLLSYSKCGWYLTITFPVKLSNIGYMANLSKTNIQKKYISLQKSVAECFWLYTIISTTTIRNYKIVSVNPFSIITFLVFKDI